MKSDVQIGDNRLVITRIFDAPRERVFAAWKSADKVQQWWGCRMTTKVQSVIDFRPGGSFTHKQHMEGMGELVLTGTYDEIVEPEKIAYHAEFAGASTRVTIEFIQLGNQTKLILTQDGFPKPEFSQHVAQGTTESLDKLEELLVRHAA